MKTRPGTRLAAIAFATLAMTGATAPQALDAADATAQGPTLTVHASRGRHPISPLIYGVNFADTSNARSLGLTVDRWGGNSTSRYNYRTGFHNTGSDYFYENIPPDHPNVLPHIAFINGDRSAGLDTVLTVPLIGWTPKPSSPSRHPYACGFKVSLYGAQDEVDPYDTNCGKGLHNGHKVTGNAPSDTSVAIGPAYVTAWVQQLVSRYGKAAHGGVPIYQLDNEPSLWNSTHRDVHPKPTTYDELFTKAVAYAQSIKAVDPTAAVLGPGDWGWCAYFFSGSDPGGCSDGADRQAHGDQAFAPWYLGKFAAYQAKHGRRLLDYFDEHFYPQSDGVSLSPAGDAATQALRLRATRSLWDPSYKDESWISDLAPGGVAVQMIPRMRSWIASQYPGTKPSMTEYNFGGLESINGALAQADVLGIFGREGLDLATLWGAGGPNQPWAFAFRMFRNYDGKGSGFGSTSVDATSYDPGQPNRPNGGQDRLSIYAATRPGGGPLTLIVINKTGSALTSPLTINGFAAGRKAQVWRYSTANPTSIVRAEDAHLSSSGSVSLAYPANSITLLVVPHA